ncbi:MAG: prolipoprotein diacylglyceryl transferase [Candidatus Gracilibacteria bacterium]
MPFPDISPFIIQIGNFGIRWYSMMYLIGFILAWIYYSFILLPKGEFPVKKENIPDMLFYAFIGLLIGARTFYMFFYNLEGLLNNPLSFFEVWNGGLSFHGGLLGVVTAMYIFAKKNNFSPLYLGDRIILPIPLALFFGRIGNFINGELYGRVVSPDTFSWCVVFPAGGDVCRYPSQLFEAVGEGLLIFIIINIAFWIGLKKRIGATLGLFFVCYGVIRMLLEFTREPDAQIGFLFQYFSMGQLLSIPLILIGLILMFLPAKLRRK